ncbi:hypothetical protein BKA70DRAFT_1219927 [Coprinopsis sp. MPI-PUGE-AT-0042]|nr:hypothetical protein BKA70DRAFT_1219927 [Coprinopsis sp. MPI-PUGE-AT-0042]
MGTVGSIVALRNGHGDVHVGLGTDSDALNFSYKHGEHIAQTTGLTPEEMKARILSYSNATFDLHQLLGNQIGHLRWGMNDPALHGRARNFTLNESRLLVELRTDDNKWVWDCVDLDHRFKIGTRGEIFALESTKDDAKIIATGRASPRPDFSWWPKGKFSAEQQVLE